MQKQEEIEWNKKELYVGKGIKDKEREAKEEGFNHWQTVLDYFIKKYGSDAVTVHRIEFVNIPKCLCGKTMNVRDDGTLWCACGRGCVED